MRFHFLSPLLLGSLSITPPVASFAPHVPIITTSIRERTSTFQVYARNPAEHHSVEHPKTIDSLKNAISAAALATVLWTAPASFAGASTHFSSFISSQVVASSVANAKEMASGTGSRVNKDPESLLRYGLPIDNKEVRELQKYIESIRLNVSSKRKTAALDDLKKARSIVNTKEAKMTSSCRDANICSSIIQSMKDKMGPLEESLQASTNYLNGSDQEREALDKSYATQDKIQKALTALEEQMVPAGYVTPVPSDYNDLPQLHGRATVEMLLKKPNGESFDIEGTLSKEAKMTMVIDGFAAPVTAGNFIDLVQKGFYNNMDIQRSDGFVVQTGDPKGEAEGYVGTPSKAVGAGKHGERLIPLEIFVKGDKGPFYETTIEDEGRGGQATVLPFSSYGAMGWAREEYEPNSGSSQFFWLLFDSDLTPAGKNVLDGRYPCFGYVVEGADFLRDIKEGDIIVSAKVTDGAEKLVQPK
ncbi:hypothetical protein ACHAWX_004236 [Stephanocyclus meneghinianus]